MPTVAPRYESAQYDGTNGAYIAGTLNTGITFVSDTGTVLTYKDGDNINRTMNLGEWMVVGQHYDSYPYPFPNAQYGLYYVEVLSIPDITLAMGYALTPAITGSGGTANVAVDLNTSMSGTNYEASAALAGTSALLADLEITSVAITDSNTVTVTVQNNGLLALAGATVIVTAAELT